MRFSLAFIPLSIALLAAQELQADSLFTQAAEQSGTMVSGKRLLKEGDIVIVTVKEIIDANTTSNLDTKKQVTTQEKAADADNQFLTATTANKGLGILPSAQLPNWNLGVNNETKSTGTTQRKTTLNTSVSCIVKEVLPHGNVRIEGEKQLQMNREDSTIKIEGVARTRDIASDNTILSTQLANAKILLRGKGPLWNNQRRGLFTRLLDWISPY